MDGFTAAWAIWKRWGDAPEYVACNYGMQPPAVLVGKHVLIVDFSFPRPILDYMVNEAGAASVVIFDHHKTAQADLEPFQFMERSPGGIGPADVPEMLCDLAELGRPPIIALFDMDRSGAGMAWDFANSDGELRLSRPMLVDMVEDRDLWRFALGDGSKFLHLALTSGPATFDRWDQADRDIDGFVATGHAIAAYRDRLVDEIVERATVVVIADEYGVGVDCPYALASDVGHRLLEEWPDAWFAAAIVRGEQTISYSLRSHDDRADVSVLAKNFGGGGHRNAAGFKVPRT
jgi:oligoribonuclease NrnB/cAMP/cGMP phosphodiesterase (DHH superfamily)